MSRVRCHVVLFEVPRNTRAFLVVHRDPLCEERRLAGACPHLSSLRPLQGFALGSGNRGYVGAFSRFCMLLLKASYCISFCLSLPTSKMGLIPPTSLKSPGFQCMTGLGGHPAQAWGRGRRGMLPRPPAPVGGDWAGIISHPLTLSPLPAGFCVPEQCFRTARGRASPQTAGARPRVPGVLPRGPKCCPQVCV